MDKELYTLTKKFIDNINGLNLQRGEEGTDHLLDFIKACNQYMLINSK